MKMIKKNLVIFKLKDLSEANFGGVVTLHCTEGQVRQIDYEQIPITEVDAVQGRCEDTDALIDIQRLLADKIWGAIKVYFMVGKIVYLDVKRTERIT